MSPPTSPALCSKCTQVTNSGAPTIDAATTGPASRHAPSCTGMGGAASAGSPRLIGRSSAPSGGEALGHAERSNAEIRELAHGILPAVLTRGGLRAAVDAVVARLDLPVRVDVPAERFPADVEASAYFIIAEALTNVVKHSRATRAEITGSVHDAVLRVEVRDDGIGGADPDGHGLMGMSDRVAALGGRLRIESPAGGGTLVAASLPL